MLKGSTHTAEANAKNAVAHRQHEHCIVPECLKPHSSRGLCPMHLKRLRRHGSLEKPIRLGPNTGKTFSADHRAKISAKHVGKVFSAESRARMSSARMGKAPWNRGRSLGYVPTKWLRVPPQVYKGIRFRSTYEVRFAKALDARGIAWQYEPKRFDLGTCFYTPDFYTPDLRCWWETKGWYGPAAKEKTRLFRKLYPEQPLIIATLEVISAMEG